MEKYLSTLLLIFIFCVMLPSAASASTEKGYQPRRCGLDMNRNGVVGEFEDCQVCNGVTLDPDFDGVNEDLIYIDCQDGQDLAQCGTPASPCQTIRYAWTERADGPEDGAEDILCFRQVCTMEENIAPGVSGLDGIYLKPRSGSEQRDWELPLNPTMLIGWDYDDDGQYPPEDRDDIAALDGGPEKLARAFYFNSAGVRSYIELAHFSVHNYGTFETETHERGFMKIGKFGPFSTHVYLHDLELVDINRGLPSQSSTILFNLFRGGTNPRWWFFSNMNITGMSSWLARGAGPTEAEKENGPYRFQNLSVTVNGCPQDLCGRAAASTMFKLWGYVSGIEILDNVLDLNAAAWKPGGNPSHGVTPAQCSRDWTIRNNTFIDFQKALNVKGYASGNCDGEVARTTDDVLFDRNVVESTYEWGSRGDPSVLILQGNSPRETVEDVTITNNVFTSTHPLISCLWVVGGNPSGLNPGTITFAGNTCSAPFDRYAAMMIGHPSQAEPLFPHQAFVIENNLFAQLRPGDLNVWLEYEPLDLQIDHNVFDPDGGFSWMGIELPSSERQTFAKRDQTSKLCTPKFLSPAKGEWRLDPSDRCARDAGKALPAISPLDIEGEERGWDGGWDVGADESAPG